MQEKCYEQAGSLRSVGGTPVGYGGQADCCEKTGSTEIERVMRELADTVDRYDNIATRLCNRISSVTTCAPPALSDPNKASSGYQTSLARGIDDLRCQIRNITNELENVLERIEL